MLDKFVKKKEKCASVSSHSDIKTGENSIREKHSSNLDPTRGELYRGRWGEKFSHL